MLLTLLFLFSVQTHAELRPTDTLLEETVQYNFPLFAGGYDGVGGGDLVDIRKLTAWFYGDAPIKTCFHVTQDFGLEQNTLLSLIERAVDEWKEFFNERQINSFYKVPINTNFVVSDNCSFDDDLVFYFGTGPISYNLNDLRARQLYINPVAYVNKTDMTEDFLWSRGYIKFIEPFIYLNQNGTLYPDWSNEEDTFQMISHELGHVLGFLHVSDSVMSSQIAQNLFTAEESEFFNTTKNLLFPSLEEKSFKVQISEDSDWNNVQTISLNLQDSKLFIDSQEVETLHSLTDSITPLLVNLHQDEPVTFAQTKLVFFNFQGRSYTLENKSPSIEIREDGILILEALLENN